MDIVAGTSKELAIKIAYDFARGLRIQGATEKDYAANMNVWLVERYSANPLMPYLSAGFSAGYFGNVLPWVREIDAGLTRPPTQADPAHIDIKPA
jgi:hypothetical protein